MCGAKRPSRVFVHGHTYQGHPVACAAALEVQKIIKEENLLANVRKMGALLSEQLQLRLSSHPNVSDIRGRGLFWGIEFVEDKEEGTPFPAEDHVAMEIAELGISPKYGIAVYPGSGTADGVRGDHVIISPPYNITRADVELIVDTVGRLVGDYFALKKGSLSASTLTSENTRPSATSASVSSACFGAAWWKGLVTRSGTRQNPAKL